MYIERGHPGHKLATVHNKGLFRSQRDRDGELQTPTASLGQGPLPQAGLKGGMGPWAVWGPRGISQDCWGMLVPSELWEKKEKRTCWDQSYWSAIRNQRRLETKWIMEMSIVRKSCREYNLSNTKSNLIFIRQRHRPLHWFKEQKCDLSSSSKDISCESEAGNDF